jgi:hypothetical protein
MAKYERNPSLLECRSGILTSFPAQAALSRNTDAERFVALPGTTPQSMLTVIALKVSIGSSTQPYVSGGGYLASLAERNSFSCLDISCYLPFVPIRNDPGMVVNLGLRATEAGLRWLGVAA